MSTNDFSINLWDEIEKVIEEEQSIDVSKISTFQVDLWDWKSSEIQESAQTKVEQEVTIQEKPLSKKQQKEVEEKKIIENNAINILSEITNNWINIDQMPDEVQLEMFKKTQDTKKKKKYFLVWFLIFIVLGSLWLGWFYLFQNKQSFLAMIIKPKDWEKLKQVSNIQSATWCVNTMITEQPVMQVKDFYDTYIKDFNYIKWLTIPVEQKDSYLKKINLLVWSLNNNSIEYKKFRIEYNNLINEIMTK